ncbi:MAG: periplasmic heavy metal sensor [Bilophila sp.]
MKTRAFIIALSATVLLLGAGSAFAYGHGNGHRMNNTAGVDCMNGTMGDCPALGAGGAPLNAEQQKAYTGIMQDFETRITPLREQAIAKHTELNALSQNPNTRPETISALVRELTDIRSQIHKERLALNEQMTKNGITSFGMRGGMAGNAHHGGHRGGGQGGCNW